MVYSEKEIKKIEELIFMKIGQRLEEDDHHMFLSNMCAASSSVLGPVQPVPWITEMPCPLEWNFQSQQNL